MQFIWFAFGLFVFVGVLLFIYRYSSSLDTQEE